VSLPLAFNPNGTRQLLSLTIAGQEKKMFDRHLDRMPKNSFKSVENERACA